MKLMNVTIKSILSALCLIISHAHADTYLPGQLVKAINNVIANPSNQRSYSTYYVEFGSPIGYPECPNARYIVIRPGTREIEFILHAIESNSPIRIYDEAHPSNTVSNCSSGGDIILFPIIRIEYLP